MTPERLTGSSSSPYSVFTNAQDEQTGLMVATTTSYVNGVNSYHTSVTVSNPGNGSHDVNLYHVVRCEQATGKSDAAAVPTGSCLRMNELAHLTPETPKSAACLNLAWRTFEERNRTWLVLGAAVATLLPSAAPLRSVPTPWVRGKP